jgi:ABC-type transport system involved in multi-copper enzyme maturation permease subunit
MKKTVITLSLLSVFAFLVTLFNTLSDFGIWVNTSQFLQDLEFFTFLLNHVFMIICMLLSVKLISKTKNYLYLITFFIPIISVFLTWYFFIGRLLNAIFS